MVASGSDGEAWRAAWGKAPRPKPDERALWLPLHTHLADSGEIARLIWRDWAGGGVGSVIAADTDGDHETAGQIVTLAAAVHDIGKLTRAFAGQEPDMMREMEARGFRWSSASVREDRSALPHTIAGYVIVFRELRARGVPRRNAEALAAIAGSHHGVTPNDSEIRHAEDMPTLFGEAEWDDARAAMLRSVIDSLGLAPAIEALKAVQLSDASQVLITSLVIMADWIASNADLFPLAPRFEQVNEISRDRAALAWRQLDLPRPWQPSDEALTADVTDLLRSRFGVTYEANEVQRLAVAAARSMQEPGLLFIEAVMGAGKTEAALLAAEIMAYKFCRSGIFFGLPTRATADASFHRLLPWWGRLPDADPHVTPRGVALRHSSAPLND